MTIGHYQALFEYNDWANRRISHCAAGLGEAKCREPAGMYHGRGSILAALAHILDTEKAWCERCQGRDVAGHLSEEADASLEALDKRWEEVAASWRALLGHLTDKDLDAMVTNTSPRSGRRFTDPLWARLSHALNHSTQHRSEIALALTVRGYSPGDLDFLTYYAAATRLAK
jgi:uncharacterized damage-inducible protein DinB